MIHPQIWQEIPDKQVAPTIRAANHEQDPADNQQSKIGQQNEMLVFLLVQRTSWIEMVDATIAILAANALALELPVVVVVACHVGNQVQWPSEQLLRHQVQCGVDWRLLEQLVHLMHDVAHPACMLLSGSRTEHHVSLDVARGLVVLAMADLPAKVRNQQSGMAEPTDRVIQCLAWRERLMATLMCQYPESSAEQALNNGIESPETGSQWHRGDILGRAELVEQTKSPGKQEYVPGNIGETCSTGSLQAVLGYGISYLLNSKVWELKLVAVGVDQLLLRRLLEVLDRSER